MHMYTYIYVYTYVYGLDSIDLFLSPPTHPRGHLVWAKLFLPHVPCYHQQFSDTQGRLIPPTRRGIPRGYETNKKHVVIFLLSDWVDGGRYVAIPTQVYGNEGVDVASSLRPHIQLYHMPNYARKNTFMHRTVPDSLRPCTRAPCVHS